MEVAQTKCSKVGVLMMKEFVVVRLKQRGREAVTISGLIFRRGNSETSPSMARLEPLLEPTYQAITLAEMYGTEAIMTPGKVVLSRLLWASIKLRAIALEADEQFHVPGGQP